MKSRRLDQIAIMFFVMTIVAMLGVSMRAQTKPVAKTSAPANTEKTLGTKSAPITIEVFEDFQCPACGNFYETSLKQVINNYVNTGKVYLVHRDFPLDMHTYARPAARLANAAAAVGQFELMEKALFDTQAKWSVDGKIDGAIASAVPAAQLKKIRDYEAAHLTEINASIERDRTMGVQRNVNQTPTIFVTARGKTEGLPGGGVDYKLLSQYLEYLLRQ